MAKIQTVEARLAAIEQRRKQTLKDLKVKSAKLKAQLVELKKPSKSQRRLDARRKILLGAFVLEQLEHAGSSPQALTFQGRRFFDWLIRPQDRAIYEGPVTPAAAAAPSPAGVAATDTSLAVAFADKDRVKALGAQWHAENKLWFVPKGLELAPFAAWLKPP